MVRVYPTPSSLGLFVLGQACPALFLRSIVANSAPVADFARAAGKDMVDEELMRMKAIDLRVIAASLGYEIDTRDSWRGTCVMRNGAGDKIAISFIDGIYQYYSFRDENDNGTAVDFLQNRERLTLGGIRKRLRPFLGISHEPLPLFAPLEKTGKDRRRVEMIFAKATEARRHPYLEGERGIPASLLVNRRFIGTVRIDAHGNAVFPHFDKNGLCGMELRNTAFKGFSKGGSKGLWSSNEFPNDSQLVVCESAIECLSHALLFPNERARYASVAGNLNASVQPELIRTAASRLPAGSKIIAAMNPDAAGRALAAEVAQAVKRTGRSDLQFQVHEPAGTGDWNDLLRATRNIRVLTSPGEPSIA